MSRKSPNIPTTRLGYHTLRVRVPFGWTDPYGYLWHGHALSYFEMSRADLVRRFDLPARKLLEEGLAVPMVDLAVEYRSPAYDDDELEIQNTLLRPELPFPYLLFEYRIVRCADGAEVLRGNTRQLLIRKEGRTLIRIPDGVREALERIWAYLDGCPRWQEDAAS
jgi:acyl-CoA thioester hydrolase